MFCEFEILLTSFQNQKPLMKLYVSNEEEYNNRPLPQIVFLELIVLTLDKILQAWLMQQLWKFIDMFLTELPK